MLLAGTADRRSTWNELWARVESGEIGFINNRSRAAAVDDSGEGSMSIGLGGSVESIYEYFVLCISALPQGGCARVLTQNHNTTTRG